MGAIRAKIGPSGRLVIPAEYRRALGVDVGDEVVLHLEDGELRILSIERAIRRLQEAARRYRRDGEPPWSEQLIAERRAEAARE
jgi:antitoxin PrlF